MEVRALRGQHPPVERRAWGTATRIIRPDGRPWSGDQPRGLDYWRALHAIYQSDVVDERDRFYLAMAQANTFVKRFDDATYWPDRRWDRAIVLDNSAQRVEHSRVGGA